MTHRTYAMRNGEIVELRKKVELSQPLAPFVQDDTLAKPIKNLVTGKMYDSASAYKESVKNAGCSIVGNDWVGKTPGRPTNEIPERVIMDKIEKAESIISDPAKLRAHHNMNLERMERQARAMGSRYNEMFRK